MTNNHRMSNPGSSAIKSKKRGMRSALTGRFIEGEDDRKPTSKIRDGRGVDNFVPAEPDRLNRIKSRGKTVERVNAVMRGAADEGLTLAKDGRIAGRVSAELIAKAKARTGLQSDTDLIEFALANVALEDKFAQVFRDVKGTVDPGLDLGF